jgi:flagellin
MAMVINTNVASLEGQRYLNQTQMSLQTAMQRLSSGLRVNSAADDPSGLAISDRMTSQINGMGVATQNANDAISMVQTADSAMASLTDTLQSMRDLAVQAANFGPTGGSDRAKLMTQFSQLSKELGRTIQSTQFNQKNILNGSMVNANFQVGANALADNQISVNISNLANASGIGSIATTATKTTAISIGSNAGATSVSAAINVIDNAISKIDTMRATLGSVQNRLTVAISNLASATDNQSSARSRIQDANFASETSNLSRAQILQQAGTAMLAQANQSNQTVLSLLK